MFGDLNPGFLHLSPALASKYSKFLSQFKPHDIVKRLHEAEALNHFKGCFSSEPLLWYSSCIIMPQTTLSSFCCKKFFPRWISADFGYVIEYEICNPGIPNLACQQFFSRYDLF